MQQNLFYLLWATTPRIQIAFLPNVPVVFLFPPLYLKHTPSCELGEPCSTSSGHVQFSVLVVLLHILIHPAYHQIFPCPIPIFVLQEEPLQIQSVSRSQKITRSGDENPMRSTLIQMGYQTKCTHANISIIKYTRPLNCKQSSNRNNIFVTF